MVTPVRHRHPEGLRRATLLGAVAAGLLLAGCGARFGAPDSATQQGHAMLDTWRVFFIGAALVAGLIWGLVIWSVVRYRRGRHQDELPPQRQYNIPMEVVYTVGPVLLVLALFALTVVNTQRLDATVAEPDVRVDVTGFQWQWQFAYPDEGITLNGTADASPTLVVPVGATVRFHLMAADVIHSFWVPEFLTKKDLIPGIDNSIDVKVTQAGEWTGRCAEYCGLDHWRMDFAVRAVPQDEYQRWVRDTAARPQPVLAAP